MVAVHAGAYGQGVTPDHSSLITFGLIFVLMRAFANGGSSLTGIEAVSNAVSAFKPPEGVNARRVLVIEGLILGTLVAGISWLAHVTHATPYKLGVPTVLSQEARTVFGQSWAGTGMWVIVQAATALILYTGGNTSFNGFPFLANFVAEDAFLPRWLTKRGHRLVFSNGIIVLAIVSITLLAVVGSNVNNLVPFYALGVFTAFTMAGFGMAKYHHRTRERGWRYKLVINFSAGVTSLIVVLIFVIVKFSEGAWLVVVLFAVGVPALIFLNRQYRMEATVLEGLGSRGRPTRAADLLAPQRLRLHRRFRPGHGRRPALRAQPAPDLTARGPLRHRQRPGRQAAPGLDAGEPVDPARLRGLSGPPPRHRGRESGQRGRGAARCRRHRDPAAAQLRPDRGAPPA